MAHLYFQVCLLVFVLKVPPRCRGDETVSAFTDEDVVLSCLNVSITDPSSCYRMRLVKNTYTMNPSVIFEYPKKSQDAKRVNLEANRKGQTCVFLKTSQGSDAGAYDFEIWKGWDKIMVTHISLKVKDCRNLKPEVAKPGQNVSLNCSVDGETAPSNVTWAKMRGTDSVPINLPRIEMKGISLTIKSVSASDTGWYKCDYIRGQSRRCSKINLSLWGHQEAVFTTTMIPRSTFTETRQGSSYIASETNRAEGSETLTLIVVLTMTSIFTLAALTGVFIYKRYKTQRKSAEYFTESAVVYENVSLPRSPGTKNRINSLYASPEENVEGLTFQI